MKSRRRSRIIGSVVLLAIASSLVAPHGIVPAFGSTVSSASFSGGAGTAVVSGTLYAKNGGALTLSVTTSSDTKCVEVAGVHTARQTSTTAKSSWSFSFTSGTGNGIQTVTASASPNFNANNCTGQSQSPQSASYVLDNTAPVVTGSVSPAANGAGWNNSNVSITWSATDAGSGVATGPTPATDSQTANTSGVTKTATATDRLGNSGGGSVTVKLDKNGPSIVGVRSPAANANGWNNTNVTVSFTCSDTPAGIKTCPSPTTLSSSGANQSVTGLATDNADNSASDTVSGINIDKIAPSLSGAPTTAPNAAGWYRNDVAIAWSCADALSGISGSCPAHSPITGEGTGLTASASVSDRAGNSTNSTSSPAVKIDRTAPVTTATAPAGWVNTDVNVSLSASDALSGVDRTRFSIDGGAVQTGTSANVSGEGEHTLEFWSEDLAGNVEEPSVVVVQIDQTAPSISHTLSPAGNGNGWHNAPVTVTFQCSDDASGIASCSDAAVVETEGVGQTITGTVQDVAGNVAEDVVSVSIDLTTPTIVAASDREPNANGWYRGDVTV
jgi:hypothetical protein